MRLLFLTLLVFTLSVAHSQKIDIIDHGDAYLNLSEIGFIEYKFSCNDYFDCLRAGQSKLGGILGSQRTNYDYACSQFPKYLQSLNYTLWTNYRDDLDELADEFKKNSYRLNQCSKKGFTYFKLHLKKFEIISTYYKDLHNYRQSKSSQNKNLASSSEQIENEYSIKIEALNDQLDSDNELIELKEKMSTSLSELSNNFSLSINKLIRERDSLISILPMSNYAENKQKISTDFNGKIDSLEREKSKSIQDATAFWDDRVLEREELVTEKISKEKEILESEMIEEKLAQREELKGADDLNRTIEQIESDYSQNLILVNSEIRDILGN